MSSSTNPMTELLEPRLMLSAATPLRVVGDTLRIVGTRGDDCVSVQLGEAGQGHIVTFNGVEQTFDANAIQRIIVADRGGQDTLTISGTARAESASLSASARSSVRGDSGVVIFMPAVEQLTFVGNGGDDTVSLHGSDGSDVVVSRDGSEALWSGQHCRRAQGAVLTLAEGGGGQDLVDIQDQQDVEEFFSTTETGINIYGRMTWGVHYNDFERIYVHGGAEDTINLQGSLYRTTADGGTVVSETTGYFMSADGFGRARLAPRSSVDDGAVLRKGDPQFEIDNAGNWTISDPLSSSAPAYTASIETIGGLRVLRVKGTDNGSDVQIERNSLWTRIVSTWEQIDILEPYDQIDVHALGGNDRIRLAWGVTGQVRLLGGDGDDTLIDNSAAQTILDGGAGDDLLISIGGGQDRLTGGVGSDRYWADRTDSIADATRAEENRYGVHVVQSFQQPWTRKRSDASFVPMQIAGQDLRDPKSEHATESFASCSLFSNPNCKDVVQGDVGDCYLLSSLAGLVESAPHIIENMIVPLGDGTYAVRFFRNRREVYYRIDADLPVTSGTEKAFAGNPKRGSIWVSMVEKAYALFRTKANSYASLRRGWMHVAMSEVTGKEARVVKNPRQLTTARLTRIIRASLRAGRAVTLGTISGAGEPFVENHAYTILGIDADGFVTIYNPWGFDGDASGNTGDSVLLESYLDGGTISSLTRFDYYSVWAYFCDPGNPAAKETYVPAAYFVENVTRRGFYYPHSFTYYSLYASELTYEQFISDMTAYVNQFCATPKGADGDDGDTSDGILRIHISQLRINASTLAISGA